MIGKKNIYIGTESNKCSPKKTHMMIFLYFDILYIWLVFVLGAMVDMG